MNSNLDKTVVFDESCAQEELLPIESALTAEEKSPAGEDGKLGRLELLMWLLCFLFGTLFGSQFLPLIESWLRL